MTPDIGIEKIAKKNKSILNITVTPLPDEDMQKVTVLKKSADVAANLVKSALTFKGPQRGVLLEKATSVLTDSLGELHSKETIDALVSQDTEFKLRIKMND